MELLNINILFQHKTYTALYDSGQFGHDEVSIAVADGMALFCPRASSTMMMSSNGNFFPRLLALCEGDPPVTGGFPSQRPVMPSFDVFFDLRLNDRLSKQSGRRWLETQSRSLWRHCIENHNTVGQSVQISNQLGVCQRSGIITVISHEFHGVSDCRPPECLFNVLFGLTSKKH